MSNMSWLALLGRIQPGVTMQQVRADLEVIAGRIDQLHPGRTTSLSIRTATFSQQSGRAQLPDPGRFGHSRCLRSGAADRMCERGQSSAGARFRATQGNRSSPIHRRQPGRLVRQLLTESLLLSLAGGVLGSLIAFWSFVKITQFVTSHLPHGLPTFTLNVAPNIPVLAYALGLTLITGIAFGLIPALQSSRLDLNTILKGEGTYSGPGKRSGRFLLNTWSALKSQCAWFCCWLLDCCCAAFTTHRPSIPDLRRRTWRRRFSISENKATMKATQRLLCNACESALRPSPV
jgi:putative ABC transport system permease protein